MIELSKPHVKVVKRVLRKLKQQHLDLHGTYLNTDDVRIDVAYRLLEEAHNLLLGVTGQDE